MLRIIADTNIILSGLFFDKNPEKLLLLAINGDLKLIIPELVITEVNEKIEGKFSKQENLGAARDFWFVLQKAFRETKEDILSDKTTPIDCPDSDDTKILEYATKIKPDYVISGNQHVLDIKDPPCQITKLRAFLEKEFPGILED
ncbi:MAG: putative toxin-antitoxin system toxin component, PIN family [Candidatus Altiarchaeota archaeon]